MHVTSSTPQAYHIYGCVLTSLSQERGIRSPALLFLRGTIWDRCPSLRAHAGLEEYVFTDGFCFDTESDGMRVPVLVPCYGDYTGHGVEMYHYHLKLPASRFLDLAGGAPVWSPLLL